MKEKTKIGLKTVNKHVYLFFTDLYTAFGLAGTGGLGNFFYGFLSHLGYPLNTSFVQPFSYGSFFSVFKGMTPKKFLEYVINSDLHYTQTITRCGQQEQLCRTCSHREKT